MNALLVAMRRSLVELNLGLKGDLTMTEPMEKLTKALASDQVHPTATPAAWTLLHSVRAPPCQLPVHGREHFSDVHLQLCTGEDSALTTDARCPPRRHKPSPATSSARGSGTLSEVSITGPRPVDGAGIPQPAAPVLLVRQPAAAHPAAGGVDHRPVRAQVCVAVW